MLKLKVGLIFGCLLLTAQAEENNAFQLFPEGEQTLVKEKSSGSCPDINFVHNNLESGDVLLSLNPSLIFNLKYLDKEQNEKVPDGCHYRNSLKIVNGELVQTSTRFGCPKASENGIFKQSLKNSKTGLSFKTFFNDKLKLNCLYSRGGK